MIRLHGYRIAQICRGLRRSIVPCALALLPALASAATFSLNPTRVELAPQHRADIITLHNAGNAPLRMQVRAMHWSMAADGRWQLTPSNDLIVTPELIEVAPGASGQLRVGSLLDAGATEGSYRLLLNELPDLGGGKHGKTAQIEVLSEVSLPVFIEPARPERIPVLRSASITHGMLTIGIGNDGNQRLDPQGVELVLSDRNGKVLERSEPVANYVLPGATAPLQLKLSPAACKQASSVAVTWPGIAERPISHPIQTGAEACEGKDSP